jgi:competence protein ComGC
MIKQKKGFTLLLAVLVASILLAIGSAILNIALRQISLSTTGRDSHFSFYAADSGSECALYWDFKNASGTSAFLSNSTITCNNQAAINIVPVASSDANSQYLTSSFDINLLPDPYCVSVTVVKNLTTATTSIDSRGYNTCDISDPRRTERALRVKY